MPGIFARIISPPQFDDEARRLSGTLLHTITLSLGVLALASLVIGVISNQTPRTPLLSVGAAVMCFAVNGIVRRGHIRAAGGLLTAGFWLIVSTAFFVFSAPKGVYDPAFSLYVIPILVGGFIFGGRAGMGLALLNILAGFFILIDQISRGGERFSLSELMLQWSLQSLMFVVAAVLVALAYRVVQDAFTRVGHSEAQLTRQNMALQAEMRERQTVAEVLQRQQARISDALRVAGMDTWNWDLHTNMVTYPDRITEATTRFAQTFEDFIGRVHPDDMHAVRQDIADSLANGSIWSRECRYLQFADRPYQWLYITGKVYYDADGKPAGLTGVSVNITHRKQAEERFYKAFHANPTAVGISRVEDGVIIDVNNAWAQLFGNTRESWLGRRADDESLWEIEPEKEKAYQITIREKGYVHNLEIKARTHEGLLIPVLASVETIELDGKLHRIVMLQDLTERKRAEQHVLELALEKERVAFLTDFMGNISHDLKTPLTVINTSLYLLERIPEADRRQAKMDTIRDQVRLLEKFIQDILTISRLESAPGLDFKPVDANRLLRDIEAQLRSSSETKQLAITLDLDAGLPPIQADEDELARLLVNLIENAINYTPSGGSVRIHTRQDGDQVVIEVADTGMGIETGDIPNIFNRFYRTDTARAAHGGGTGLGLAIVKMVAEMHQGSVAVESAEGKGSTFRVRLPVSHPSAEHHALLHPVQE